MTVDELEIEDMWRMAEIVGAIGLRVRGGGASDKKGKRRGSAWCTCGDRHAAIKVLGGRYC